MLKRFLFVLMCASLSASLGCSSAETTNSNNKNTGNQIDSANIPPEFSTSPMPMTGNSTPGIPGANNANQMPTGNIPGIPDPNKAKTPQPKNTPPIPGIPDQETIKKQMNTPLKDVNIVNNPPANQRSTANDQPANKRGNTRQP